VQIQVSRALTATDSTSHEINAATIDVACPVTMSDTDRDSGFGSQAIVMASRTG
jgi:hypothetical protein